MRYKISQHTTQQRALDCMNQSEFKQRRQNLIKQIGKGNIALINSASKKIRNKDIEFSFRQDSSFYYLTGFNEADSLAVFIPGRKLGEYILFCHEFDEEKALWEGANAGLAGAVEYYQADVAFAISDIDNILPKMLQNKSKVFYSFGCDSKFDARLLKWIDNLTKQSRNGIEAPRELVSLEYILHEMRLFKSPEELKLMRKAADISCIAHKRAMQNCKAKMYEYQIEAELVHEFMSHGLRASAYPAIVASGQNACVLHYTDNHTCLKTGDLLLIDAGAECNYYAADITRTFPISGKFSSVQKQLYQLVLDAQYAAIAQIKPGVLCNLPHKVSVQILTQGLVRLGLLTGEVEKLIKAKKYKQFYQHKIGHWIGMDVHDVGAYKLNGEWRKFEPNMVLTIEPGLYIPKHCKTVATKWRGLGIRIEDEVLVTQQGCEVLTQSLVKEIDAIESLMQSTNAT